MGIHEPGPDDGFEIKVESLHAPSTSTQPGETGATRPLFASVRPRRVQQRRGILVTAALLVTLVALVMTITPTREALRGVVFGPTPTATKPVPSWEDNLYVTLNPHWGSVSLDNRVLTHLPVEGVDQPIHLARGAHVLRWQFAPIMDYSCRITAPTKLGDNCPLRVGITPGKGSIASVVTLQLSLTTLVPAYRTSLLAAMQAAFDGQQSSATVRPGERYLGAYSETNHDIEPVVATQPLRATLRFVLDNENSDATCPAIQSGPGANCMMNGDCREICTAPWQSPQDTPGAAWQAYIVAHATWRYTTLDGHIVADNQSDISGQLQFPGSDELPVPITISWDGSNWQVSTAIGIQPAGDLPDPVCASARVDVQNSFVDPPDPGGWGAVALAYIPGVPVASGCLLVMIVAGQPPLLVLHRFGVALAANATAARTLCCPVLPIADAYEQQLAQRILAAPQGG